MRAVQGPFIKYPNKKTSIKLEWLNIYICWPCGGASPTILVRIKKLLSETQHTIRDVLYIILGGRINENIINAPPDGRLIFFQDTIEKYYVTRNEIQEAITNEINEYLN